MKRGRELTEIIYDIKNEIPGFDMEELLQYTKWAIPKLYNSLKDNEEIKIRCNPELINKLNKDKNKYRIDKNMDHISIQYVDLYDSIKKDDEMYIQIYSSIYFYDDVGNNGFNPFANDKYWNDIWMVTYRETSKSGRKNSNCTNCGAVMKYNHVKDIFECEYCGNIIHNNSNSKWEIVDIELLN